MKRYLNVGAINYNCSVLGPGTRVVIWLQGCNLGCEGCINQKFQDFTVKRLLEPLTLAQKIIDNYSDLEGITLTGGEPFLQSESLAILVKKIKTTDLTVQIYSGFYWNELIASNNQGVYDLLKETDVLIDGRFENSKLSNNSLKGSENQNIHFLSHRYSKSDYEIDNSFQISYKNKMIRMVGFYDKEKFNY